MIKRQLTAGIIVFIMLFSSVLGAEEQKEKESAKEMVSAPRQYLLSRQRGRFYMKRTQTKECPSPRLRRQ